MNNGKDCCLASTRVTKERARQKTALRKLERRERKVRKMVRINGMRMVEQRR